MCVEFPALFHDFLSPWLHLLRMASPGLAREDTAPLAEKSWKCWKNYEHTLFIFAREQRRKRSAV